jgi:hypothetical protein
MSFGVGEALVGVADKTRKTKTRIEEELFKFNSYPLAVHFLYMALKIISKMAGKAIQSKECQASGCCNH